MPGRLLTAKRVHRANGEDAPLAAPVGVNGRAAPSLLVLAPAPPAVVVLYRPRGVPREEVASPAPRHAAGGFVGDPGHDAGDGRATLGNEGREHVLLDVLGAGGRDVGGGCRGSLRRSLFLFAFEVVLIIQVALGDKGVGGGDVDSLVLGRGALGVVLGAISRRPRAEPKNTRVARLDLGVIHAGRAARVHVLLHLDGRALVVLLVHCPEVCWGVVVVHFRWAKPAVEAKPVDLLSWPFVGRDLHKVPQPRRDVEPLRVLVLVHTQRPGEGDAGHGADHRGARGGVALRVALRLGDGGARGFIPVPRVTERL
mmetsp:Transcript_25535/g.54249  ORF Transcript_25535/g.54249 Transcript_25535/m.54249 type:complete len:312 (-) Transcript_25535:1303-2238(-)